LETWTYSLCYHCISMLIGYDFIFMVGYVYAYKPSSVVLSAPSCTMNLPINNFMIFCFFSILLACLWLTGLPLTLISIRSSFQSSPIHMIILFVMMRIVEKYQREKEKADSMYKRPVAQTPKFVKKKGESDKTFLGRVEHESHEFIKQARYENENECEFFTREDGVTDVRKKVTRRQEKSRL